MPLDTSHFLTASLRSSSWGERVARVLAAALRAVDPGEAVRRFVQRSGETLTIAGRALPLESYHNIFLAGAGKAGAPMAGALAEVLGNLLSGGVVIVKEGHARSGDRDSLRRVEIVEAGHPLPDRRGVEGTQRIIDLLKTASEGDLVLCPFSGGGSALMTAPVGDISLGDLQGLTTLLLGCGASIDEINTLRKHLDQVKGGKLARLAAPAQVITLILSDVVGDPLDVIASGPTVPDPTTFAVAWGILDRYNLLERTPTSILAYLRRGLLGEVPETPKGGDSAFMGVQNVVVGNNRLAARAALAEAEALGFHSLLLTTYLQGEARQAGRFLAAIARQLASDAPPLPRPACIVCGGETTVTLSGDGQGGRNQEVALGAVAEMAGLNDIALVTLATDGGDGPTDAAGAVVTGETLFRASARGLLPADFLARNDSYHFFAALEDLFKTGPTQTNVNDLALVFAF